MISRPSGAVAVLLTTLLLGAGHGGVDVEAIQSEWIAGGRIRLVAPHVARSFADPTWDPREHLSETAAIIDLSLGDDGRWSGEAGVGLVVSGQAPPGAWEIHDRDAAGTLRLKAPERIGAMPHGCWSSGWRTVADAIVLRPRSPPDGWWASMCGIRYPVVAFEGRTERAGRWENGVLRAITSGLEVDLESCELHSVACNHDRLAARCDGVWVVPTSRGPRAFRAPDPETAPCSRGPVPDTGVEVPDPCMLPRDDVPDCRLRPYKTPASTLSAEPSRARPYVRWCEPEQDPWLGPGLHPEYRPGRPHGAVLACWRRALERDPLACGEFSALVARPFSVGGPTQVGGVSETVGDPSLAECLHGALEEWEPPGPADGGEIRLRGFLRSPAPNVPRSAESTHGS